MASHNNDEISESIPNTDELDNISDSTTEVVDVQILVEQMKPYMGGSFVQEIHGNTYPKVEWWNQLGAFVGVKPVVENDNRLDISSARHSRDGEITYEATIQLRSIDGKNTLHGRATSMCSSIEKMWANTDEFAIRSMAQTRATGKSFRLGYSNVALACGIQATPAEEMMGIEKPISRQSTPQYKPTNLTHTSTTVEKSDGSYVINFGQWKSIRPNGITLDEIYAFDEWVEINGKRRKVEGKSWIEFIAGKVGDARPGNEAPAICKKFLDEKRGMAQESKQTSVLITDVPSTKNSMPDNVRQMLQQIEVNPGAWKTVASDLTGIDKSFYDYTEEEYANLSTALSRKLEGSSQGEMNV